jgi:pyruvate ferredoxin oxidoreductase alpha subunit
MRELLEGSKAVARAVALCRPDVVCAYPISPQTHIVEALSAMVRTGGLVDCDYINVESEFAAMSVAIGASAAGGRVYTATASQGLLYMAEAVYNASGLGLPIVMTVANRAIGAPINIWNDQSDSLSQRDSGWLQLFAVDNQEAVDLHIIAYRLAEEISIPIMVCMDGFVLTHATDVIDMPTQEQVDAFLPPFTPREALDIDHPQSIGMMAGPDIFTETKYLAHQAMLGAIDRLDAVSAEFAEIFGRSTGRPVRLLGTADAADAGSAAGSASNAAADAAPTHGTPDPVIPGRHGQIAVIAMGSVLGTLEAVVPHLRADGVDVHLIGLGAFRPFPSRALAHAIGQASRVVVFDRAIQVGVGGVLSGAVRRAMKGSPAPLHSVVAGLGGRPITEHSLAGVVRQAHTGDLADLTFMDLRTDVIEKVS